MLRTGFIGSDNFFDRYVCQWLKERTDLRLLLWTNRLSWAGSGAPGRVRRVARRFARRARSRGVLRAVDEALYYLLYRKWIQAREVERIVRLVQDRSHPVDADPLRNIRQIAVEDIRSPELRAELRAQQLDALFSVCIDVYLPPELIDIPRHGTFLWHEGITPEYRGVYSPFWALARRDYERLGYTLLRMNGKLDAGAVYVQGRAEGIDPMRDWHSYIGHKAILDSLPAVGEFIQRLERDAHQPVDRSDAIDGYYSYPTASALLRIVAQRRADRMREGRPKSSVAGGKRKSG